MRDRLAWELHRRLQDRSLLVAREWRRADLAVVRERIQLLKENSNNPELTGDARHAVPTKDSRGSEQITLAEGLAIIDELIQRYAHRPAGLRWRDRVRGADGKQRWIKAADLRPAASGSQHGGD